MTYGQLVNLKIDLMNAGICYCSVLKALDRKERCIFCLSDFDDFVHDEVKEILTGGAETP